MLVGNSLKFGNSSGQTDYLLLLFSWHWFLPVQLLSQNVARLHEEAAAKSITMRIPARWHRWKDLVVQLLRSFATWGMEEIQKKAKPPDVINLLLLYNVYLEQFTQWRALLGVTGGTGTWCRAGMSRSSGPPLGWENYTRRNLQVSAAEAEHKTKASLSMQKPVAVCGRAPFLITCNWKLASFMSGMLSWDFFMPISEEGADLLCHKAW